MAISETMGTWAGKSVVEWTNDSGVTDPEGSAYKIGVSYDDEEEGVTWADRFAAFLEDPRVGEVTALVIGNWDADDGQDESTEVVEALTAAAENLPHLNALFIGDITYEENEISWIRQSDLSPIFNAFPGLEHFGVRGSSGLSLGVPRLAKLKTLTIESGGLPLNVLEEVFAADLPALTHLELWLGTEGYGAQATMENLAPVLGEEAVRKWPGLTYLGLRDSDLSDEIAIALTQSPILGQLETLDLSLGVLSDTGASALAASTAVAGLKRLDIHHHYVSDEVVENLKTLGIEVNADEPQKPDTWNGESHRYVAVGE